MVDGKGAKEKGRGMANERERGGRKKEGVEGKGGWDGGVLKFETVAPAFQEAQRRD